MGAGVRMHCNSRPAVVKGGKLCCAATYVTQAWPVHTAHQMPNMPRLQAILMASCDLALGLRHSICSHITATGEAFASLYKGFSALHKGFAALYKGFTHCTRAYCTVDMSNAMYQLTSTAPWHAAE